MVNLVVLIIIILSILSGLFGFAGIYILTSLGWSLLFMSGFLFFIMSILGYLARNYRG